MKIKAALQKDSGIELTNDSNYWHFICDTEAYKKFPSFAFEIDGEFYILHKDNFIE